MVSCKKTSFKKLRVRGKKKEMREGSKVGVCCPPPHLWHIQVKAPGHLRKEVPKMSQIPWSDRCKFNNSLSENEISNNCWCKQLKYIFALCPDQTPDKLLLPWARRQTITLGLKPKTCHCTQLYQKQTLGRIYNLLGSLAMFLPALRVFIRDLSSCTNWQVGNCCRSLSCTSEANFYS